MTRVAHVAPGVGGALAAFLMIPAVARALEETLAAHMLVQIPLLILAGGLLGVGLLGMGLPERRPGWLGRLNDTGAPGMVLAIAMLICWMLPRALDGALFHWQVEVVKFVSVPAIGALVVVSWPRLGFVARNFVILNGISMFVAEGWLYFIAPVRLCSAYLIDDQATVGSAFLGVAGALFASVLWRALAGLPARRGSTHFPVVPVSFFGIVLGVSGLGNCWRVAAQIWGAPAWIGEAVLLLAAGIWFLLLVLFALKWIYAREAALAEIRHPIMSCYVGLVFVTTLLVSVAAVPYSRGVALALAVAGWGGHILFSSSITGSLWKGRREPGMTTAVLYLPTVAGNFVAAIAAGNLGFANLGVLFLGAGLLSWLAIESVLMHQLYTTEAGPAALRPTLGIQLAPPVVCCVAYLSVNSGTPDLFAQILFGYGLLQAGVMIRLIPWFFGRSFVPGHWAFSFGVVALPLSALKMLQYGITGPVAELALPLFAAANVIIGYFLLRTAWLLVTARLLAQPIPQPAPATVQ
ncbi:MAG: dicarboxylate transporter/tellurite-resistance protein TehA [Solirubrobacterales bacterium]